VVVPRGRIAQPQASVPEPASLLLRRRVHDRRSRNRCAFALHTVLPFWLAVATLRLSTPLWKSVNGGSALASDEYVPLRNSKRAAEWRILAHMWNQPIAGKLAEVSDQAGCLNVLPISRIELPQVTFPLRHSRLVSAAISNRCASGRYWPKLERPLWSAERRRADVRC
jgi:hypothetical protein